MITLKGRNILPDEIITVLKKDILLKDVCQKIFSQEIIHKIAAERGITLTPEEIQAEVDRLRYAKRLIKASDTLAWLAQELITADEWEAGICDRLLSQKLAESLFAKEVEKFFAENKLDFEQISLYQIVVPYEGLAQEIYYQIEEGEMSFFEAAHLYDIDEKRRQKCGYEGKLYRYSLNPEVAAAVFNAKLYEVLGPFRVDQASQLLMVDEFIPAELTAERYQEILQKIFQEWLIAELNYVQYS